MDILRKCEFCGCSTNAIHRTCCDAGNKADLAHHIQKSEQRRRNTDYPTLYKPIIDALEHLTADQLNKVAIYITELRRAAWGLDKTPGPPIIASESINEAVRAIKPGDLYQMDKRLSVAPEPTAIDEGLNPTVAGHARRTAPTGKVSRLTASRRTHCRWGVDNG